MIHSRHVERQTKSRLKQKYIVLTILAEIWQALTAAPGKPGGSLGGRSPASPGRPGFISPAPNPGGIPGIGGGGMPVVMQRYEGMGCITCDCMWNTC